MQRPVRAIWEFGVQVVGLLGLISLVVWLKSVADSKHHHPLDFWLVLALGLFLVSALIWGYRRGRPTSTPTSTPTTVHQTYVQGDQYVFQTTDGQTPRGEPPAPREAEPGA